MGKANTLAPNARNPRAKALRIVGANRHRTAQIGTNDIMTIGELLSVSLVNAAKAGVSAITVPIPKMTPMRIRKDAFNIGMKYLSWFGLSALYFSL